MAITENVDWRAELGGGVRVALIQAGAFRTDAGAIFGPVPYMLWREWAGDEPDGDGAAGVDPMAPGRSLVDPDLDEAIEPNEPA